MTVKELRVSAKGRWYHPVNRETIRHLLIGGFGVSISLARRRRNCVPRAAHVGETATTRGSRLHVEQADARTAPFDSIGGTEAGPNADFTIDKGMSRHGVVNCISAPVTGRSR
jgi:hypothetical protein